MPLQSSARRLVWWSLKLRNIAGSRVGELAAEKAAMKGFGLMLTATALVLLALVGFSFQVSSAWLQCVSAKGVLETYSAYCRL